MNGGSQVFIVAAVTGLVALACSTASALTFRKVDDRIEASGTIEPGDAARLAAFLRTLPPQQDSFPDISLNSPGGNLAEGILLGRLLRQYSMASVVRRGSECYSACAVAFLGGTQAYSTGSGVGRYIEVGAKLGFHGFSATEERVVLLNEAFDVARIFNGLIIQYASEMQNINLALLSSLLTIAPKKIRIVNTPKELNGLGIVIRGTLPPRPMNWALIACGKHIDHARPLKDGPLEGRISSRSERRTVGSEAEFRQLLLADLFDGSTRQLLSRLPAAEFIKLASDVSPKYPVQRIAVQRGAGLYYDYCYAFEPEYSSGIVATLLVSEIGDGSKSAEYHGPLGWYNDNAPLW